MPQTTPVITQAQLAVLFAPQVAVGAIAALVGPAPLLGGVVSGFALAAWSVVSTDLAKGTDG